MTEGLDLARPPCPHCRRPYPQEEAARHTVPVDCSTCYRCRDKPACYPCGHMYCACAVHEHG